MRPGHRDDDSAGRERQKERDGKNARACATPPDAKKGLLILRVSDAKKAMKVLNS